MEQKIKKHGHLLYESVGTYTITQVENVVKMSLCTDNYLKWIVIVSVH